MPAAAPLVLRPYHLLEAVCARGRGDAAPASPRVRDLLALARQTPDHPVTLQCNVHDVFAFQDPGPADDTPEGPEFNLWRDLEILHRLDLCPGVTLPARILVQRVLTGIEDVADLWGTAGDSAAWPACPAAWREDYRRGRALGLGAFVPPRPAAELRQCQAESLAAMAAADAVNVRPHLLLCAVCQYGGGTRPPFADDNLPELLQLVFARPETRIRLVAGADWMMCAPCPWRAPGLNACVIHQGSGGLPNQMRDLRVLHHLGLRYGDVLPARELFRRIFARLPGTLATCRLAPARPSVWWDPCGAAPADSAAYAKGRDLIAAQLGLPAAPAASVAPAG